MSLNKNEIPKYVLASVLLAMLAIGGYAFSTATMYASAPASAGQESIYKGMVNVKQIRDGKVIWEETNHNILTLNGSNFTTSQLFGSPSAAGATEIENISLGNGTGTSPQDIGSTLDFGGITNAGCSGLAPSNTLVWANVMNNTAGTYVSSSGNVSANKVWTSACGSGTGIEVNRTAISSTTNAFFAVNQFTNVFLQSGDQLNVTWYVWIT